MPSLPRLDVKTNINHSPHVVLLGAGASLAALPNGDKNGKYLPLMANLVQVLGLESLLAEHGILENITDFEKFFSQISKTTQYSKLATEVESQIYDYFSSLELPDEPTIYDYLILSLRKTDIIATFNWDPFLAQAYRRNMSVTEPPRICFLHGNVSMGACIKDRGMGFKYQVCSKCGEPLTPSRLLYPVTNKNYQSDPYINSEWECLKQYLKKAYLVTVFGYSAPVSDVEARSIMLDVWNNNPTRDLAEISIIDVKSRESVEESWQDFFVRQHYGVSTSFDTSLLHRHPRRRCDAFAMATLQKMPWQDNSWPKFSAIDEMHAWISPLIQEESNEYFSGNPCTKLAP